jgi:hypothetical protein
MNPEALLIFVGLMATMLGGVFIIWSGIRHRAQSLEMAHKERMAMIEKGLVPSPEANPAHRAWTGGPPPPPHSSGYVDHAGSQRSVTLGIVMVAIGLGFMSIIGFAAETPSVALGIGGAIVIVGIAFIVIGQVKRSAAVSYQPHSAPPRPPAIPDRPSDSSL